MVAKMKHIEDIGDVPVDYEPCGECGFDHEYECAEAHEAHRQDGFEKAQLDKLDAIRNGDFE